MSFSGLRSIILNGDDTFPNFSHIFFAKFVKCTRTGSHTAVVLIFASVLHFSVYRTSKNACFSISSPVNCHISSAIISSSVNGFNCFVEVFNRSSVERMIRFLSRTLTCLPFLESIELVPVAPVLPCDPVAPVAPCAPVLPCDPVAPCAPVFLACDPVAPCAPVLPCAPVAPCAPIPVTLFAPGIFAIVGDPPDCG